MKQQKIMEQQTPITLDERINQDLAELYNILHKSVPLKAIKGVGSISAAVELSEKLYSGDKHEDDDAYELSTLGLPGYYAGERNAKTVMVMLNPGVRAEINDTDITEISKYGFDTSSLEAFINSYHSRCQTGVEQDLDKEGKIRIDNFDIKQAAFLKDWTDSGVTIPDVFPCNGNEDRDVLRETRVNVLKQKLQLELVPYASQKFSSLGRKKLCYLFPYLETVLDEIFRVDNRKYVIFCSGFFARLFKAYSNEATKNNQSFRFKIELLEKRPYPDILSNGNVYCTPVRIANIDMDKDKDKDREIVAIIAHTFPSYALPNAYDKMREYGHKCFECLNEYQQTHKP